MKLRSILLPGRAVAERRRSRPTTHAPCARFLREVR